MYLKENSYFFKGIGQCWPRSRRGFKKNRFPSFSNFLDTLMRVEHNLIKVRSGMPAFSRNHMISVDFGDLSGTR